MNKSIQFSFLIAVGLMLGTCASASAVLVAGNGDTRQVKNVVFLLSDGTANEAWTLTRWVKGKRLDSDDILTGAVRTYGADSIITDSAPGSTSYATGRGDAKARLPLSKNLVLVNGKIIELEGIVVLAEKLNKVFLPRQAIDIVTVELK